MRKLIWILSMALCVNAHAAIVPNDTTFGFVDVLQWQVRESGADNWAQIFTTTGTLTTIKVIDAPFGWNTGLRVGVGRTFNQRSFDVVFAYTTYQVTATNQAAGKVTSAFDGTYFVNNVNGSNLGIPYSYGNVRWQLFYNTFDLDVGRQFKLAPVLQVHPYVGLKAASINQTIYTNWLNPIPPTNFTKATENIKNDFSGIGPVIGADTTWALYTGAHQTFNLIGNIAGGLLVGHWHFNEVYSNNVPTNITVFVSSVNGLSPLVSGLLGLQWNKQFTQSDISVRLGYEAQVWYNQVQFYSLNLGRVNRPLSVQGGNLEFRLNF